MDYILKVENVSKKYSDFSLNHINIKIPKGCITGLIGENGAGKTTIIKLILNLVKSDNGKIEVFGKDNILYEESIKKNLGVYLGENYFHECLDAIALNSIMKSIYPNWNEKKYFEYLKKFSLPQKKEIGKYSKGMKAKLNIAVTLSSNPQFLILDEPTTGLDPVVRNEVLDIYTDYAKNNNCSILFSSHITTDLEKVADNIIFIHKGKIILSETKEELFNEYCKVCLENDNYINKNSNDFISYIKENEKITLLMKKSIYKEKYSNYSLSNLTFEDIFLSLIRNQKQRGEGQC